MAAASTLQYGRQKKSVYGKATKSTWSATNFFDDSEDELASNAPPPAVKVSAQRSVSVKATYPVKKKEIGSGRPAKASKPKPVSRDSFDVPSSDEEFSPPPKVVRKPAFKSNKLLVNDQVSVATAFAPWEQRHDEKPPNDAATHATRSAAPGVGVDAKPHGVARALSSSGDRSSANVTSSHSDDGVLNVSSAAAKLAARRRVVGSSATSATERPLGGGSKRVPATGDTDDAPRKRARTAETLSSRAIDTEMIDEVAPIPSCDNIIAQEHNDTAGADIYDFPSSSADESLEPRQRSKSPRVTKQSTRRSKATTYTRRVPTQKGLSAPARLAEMLPTDTDMTEASAASPTNTMSRAASPLQPSTPPTTKRPSPATAIRSGSQRTPKQAQLWDRLLQSPPVASPSALAMEDLTISGRNARSVEVSTERIRMAKSRSEAGRRKTRLVDRLKASAESSSEEDASDTEGDGSDGPAGVAVHSKPPLLRTESTNSRAEAASGSQSQSRSQTTVSVSNGLKRTYASQRSHLAEDNFEDDIMDDIMAGMIEETPKQPAAKPKAYGRSQSSTQRSAFDIEDSDDDGAAAGVIRSVHELRAAGRNIRGTEDIEQMMEDIENYSLGHRSRRRSALIEIATKLADKDFAGRFIGQGCDVRLARQRNAPRDDIASFALVAAFALLMASEPPEHTLRTLQEHELATWLATLLSATREVGRMARERQYNMAKASQTSFVQFAKFVQIQTVLWSDKRPMSMSTRIVALKALDILIRGLRRVGDRSELLQLPQLPLVLLGGPPANNQELDTSLAVSILESLSTASLTHDWNEDLLKRLAQTLASMDASTAPRRHTLFLTLRLCLNLTTDNARNCSVLATDRSIPFLFKTVLDGFAALDAETEEETRTLALDLLVLSLGILINLFEYSSSARSFAAASVSAITALVETFTAGQQRMLDAESVAESISNVALGYLAVVLANLSQETPSRATIRDALPGKQLSIVGDAVEEFVVFHQQVDVMAGAGFQGEEGAAVWGGFTDKLRAVLERVRGFEGED